MKEMPDLDKPGAMKAWIEQQEITYLNIRQQKTGAILMYLAGIDLYDIMKVTGHASPKMLKKFIKADSLEVVQKLTDKYDYFN